MYIKVKNVYDSRVVQFELSLNDEVAKLRKMIQESFGVPVDRQRLCYFGKLIADDGTLFEYGVKNNTCFTLCPKIDISQEKINSSPERDESQNDAKVVDDAAEIPCTCEFYEVGDIVDVVDGRSRGWYEGKINEIVKCDRDIYYKISILLAPNDAPLMVKREEIRPVSREIIQPDNVLPGDVIMINYNKDEPTNRGYWYDLHVKVVQQTRINGPLEIRGNIHVSDGVFAENVSVVFLDEIMRIMSPKRVTDRTLDEKEAMKTEPLKTRKTAPFCNKCKDNPRRKCRECGCGLCGGKEDPDKLICCDQCEYCFHMGCLDPPLTEIPSDDWYCPSCKTNTDEIAETGQKRKVKKPLSNRDWGKGMACVGRSQVCNIVDSGHFGPIPGIDVGTMWRYRVQCSESGVHRPPVSGIHGRAKVGAFSIVFSGGYECVDHGDEFVYTGAGGRDLSGNKRTNKQSCDQTLTRENLALALNCAAKFNENGAEAKDWRLGKPVRVVRSFKLRKTSKFAPLEGLRYDGVYKVVKYYQTKGSSGFLEWRYLMRRDDEAPAPWTKAGKARILELGLTMPPEKGEKENLLNIKRKRGDDDSELSNAKKFYRPEEEALKAIKADQPNAKIWNELILIKDKPTFLDGVVEKFTCAICMELTKTPVTSPCAHNFCLSCLNRLFDALGDNEQPLCPNCRQSLSSISSEKDRKAALNENLKRVISILFPGY